MSEIEKVQAVDKIEKTEVPVHTIKETNFYLQSKVHLPQAAKSMFFSTAAPISATTPSKGNIVPIDRNPKNQ